MNLYFQLEGVAARKKDEEEDDELINREIK